MKQSRDMEDFFRDEELSGREDVVISMKEKWYKQREREQDIEGDYPHMTLSGTNA